MTPKTDPNLLALLRRAASIPVTEEMLRRQRESYARAEVTWAADMATDAIAARLAEIERQIAEAPCWGAALSELNEERQELRREMRRRKP